MKVNYVKTIGFRKFEKEFETELYDVTSITGQNRSGKSNILYAIINTMLGTNLSGDEKACLINKNCDASYGELNFTDNRGVNHVLIRGRHRTNSKNNILTLDGKNITQNELISFYKDKKLFLSIINPLYFLNKKPNEQKEMVDKYLSDIEPIEIFRKLPIDEQERLLHRYFKISIREIYSRLNTEQLEELFNKYNLNKLAGKNFDELDKEELRKIFFRANLFLKDLKYYEMFTDKEKIEFINLNIRNIFMDISYDKLESEEQKLLEGIPQNIPTYISDLNKYFKQYDLSINGIDAQINYLQNNSNKKLPEYKTFEKEVELTLAKQELAFLNSNQDIIDKEKQKKVVENLEAEILNKETEIKELEKKMQEGKKKYLAIKNDEISTCPTCNQHIENSSKIATIKNMKESLTKDFGRKNLLETKKKDLELTYTVERCKYHSFDGESTIEKSKRISTIEETIKKLETEKLEIEQFNQNIKAEEELIKAREKDIANLNAEKEKQIKYMENIRQARKIAQKLYILYIEEKMKLAKHYLKDVDIKFYSVLKTTGEIKEDFIITYKNRSLCDLSRSETIATALEFANMFNKIAKTNFPIFIDDYESCADYDFIEEYSTETQLLVSKVEKGTLLSITDYYNNVADIQKAA